MIFTLSYGLFLGFTAGFLMLNLPPVLDQLLVLYNVSYGGASVLLSAVLWSHAAVQLPGGMILDRLGTRRTLSICIGCLLAGSLIPVIVPSLPLAIFGRVIAGFGTGLTFLAVMKMIVLVAEPKYVSVFQSFLGGIYNLGSILAFFLLPKLTGMGWRTAHLAPGLLVLVCAVIFPLLRLKKESLRTARKMSLKSISRLKGAWMIAFLHSLSYGSLIVLSTWMPSFLAELTGQSSTAGFLWIGVVIMLLSGIFRILSGFLLFRFRAWTVGFITILITVLCYLLATVFRTPSAAVTATVLIAIFGSINFGAFWYIAGGLSDAPSLGTVLGFVNLLNNIFTVLYTMMFGWSKELLGSFSYGLGTMMVLSTVALLLGNWLFAGKTSVAGTRPSS